MWFSVSFASISKTHSEFQLVFYLIKQWLRIHWILMLHKWSIYCLPMETFGSPSWKQSLLNVILDEWMGRGRKKDLHLIHNRPCGMEAIWHVDNLTANYLINVTFTKKHYLMQACGKFQVSDLLVLVYCLSLDVSCSPFFPQSLHEICSGMKQMKEISDWGTKKGIFHSTLNILCSFWVYRYLKN